MFSPSKSPTIPSTIDIGRMKCTLLEQEIAKVSKETEKVVEVLSQTKKLLKRYKKDRMMIANHLERHHNDKYWKQELPVTTMEGDISKFIIDQVKRVERHEKFQRKRIPRLQKIPLVFKHQPTAPKSSIFSDALLNRKISYPDSIPGVGMTSSQTTAVGIASSTTTPSSAVPGGLFDSQWPAEKKMTNTSISSSSSSLTGVPELKKSKKDPDAPKRPSNVFFIFCERERANIQAKMQSEVAPGAELDKKEIQKRLSVVWKGMSDDDKKQYFDVYNAEKAKYGLELEKYNTLKQKSMQQTIHNEGAATTGNVASRSFSPAPNFPVTTSNFQSTHMPSTNTIPNLSRTTSSTSSKAAILPSSTLSTIPQQPQPFSIMATSSHATTPSAGSGLFTSDSTPMFAGNNNNPQQTVTSNTIASAPATVAPVPQYHSSAQQPSSSLTTTVFKATTAAPTIIPPQQTVPRPQAVHSQHQQQQALHATSVSTTATPNPLPVPVQRFASPMQFGQQQHVATTTHHPQSGQHGNGAADNNSNAQM